VDLDIKSALEYLEKSIIAKNEQAKLLQDEITKLKIEYTQLNSEIEKLKQQSDQDQHPQQTTSAETQHTGPANILFGEAQEEELDLSLEQLKDLVSRK
jgi:uncharacterized protein YlxW (UPF0749 family)